MSDYYEWKLNSLQDALEFCDSYRAMRNAVVFRGQKNAAWELKSNLFRGRATQDEVNKRLHKTDTFFQWCQQNHRLPEYSEDQLFHIAQHYGMYTDLLDFSTSPEVAAFFALGAPRHDPPHDERAAIFVLDPDDLRQLPRIADNPTLASAVRSLVEILQQYAGAYQENRVPGLSRLVAQDGVFVRDVGGMLESLLDPVMSLLPLVFEEEIGRPLLLKKASFNPRPGDVNFLASRGCSFDRLFPPPNDLERDIGRFFDAFSATEYHEAREHDDDRAVIEIKREKFDSTSANKSWDSTDWKQWTSLNLSTTAFTRPTSRELETWSIPEAELYSRDPSPSLSRYVSIAIGEGTNFKSRLELCVDSSDGRMHLPMRIQTLLETLLSFPYVCGALELAIRKSIILLLNTSSLTSGDLVIGNETARKTLGLVFQPDDRWNHVDVICHDDGHSVKMMLPFEALAELDSVAQAVADFQVSDVGKEYGDLSNKGYGLYCMMFHRPMFRSLFEPKDAIDIWARYAIPWQARFGPWKAAVLNPFMVEFIGLS